MLGPVDISGFPTGAPDIGYDDPADAAAFEELRARAQTYLGNVEVLPIVESLTLAFGITPILCLYLARLVCPIAEGVARGQQEVWVVVGDLPPLCFGTATARTPAAALSDYCEIAQQWADTVLEGGDLSGCGCEINAAPTEEHANMLLSRIEFIRTELIPLA